MNEVGSSGGRHYDLLRYREEHRLLVKLNIINPRLFQNHQAKRRQINRHQINRHYHQ